MDSKEKPADAVGTAAPAKPPASEAEALLTPEEHARKTGNARAAKKLVAFNGAPKAYEKFSAAHAAAAVMHGWALHEHHTGAKIALSRADYLAALAAAGCGDVPHAPALASFLTKASAARKGR